LIGPSSLDQGLHDRADVAYQRCGDGLVAVQLGGLDVYLDERRVGVPLRRLAVAQQPVQSGADEHHHIGTSQRERSSGSRGLRVAVGD